MLERVRRFDHQGRTYTLYLDGSWVLFEEDADGAEGLGIIERTATGYAASHWWHPGADTTAFGGKSHDYPEEVFIVSGRLFDRAFGLWLEAGHYASRPAGETHGPFKTETGCVVLELSFPMRRA